MCSIKIKAGNTHTLRCASRELTAKLLEQKRQKNSD